MRDDRDGHDHTGKDEDVLEPVVDPADADVGTDPLGSRRDAVDRFGREPRTGTVSSTLTLGSPGTAHRHMVAHACALTRYGRRAVVSDPVISVHGLRKRYGTHEAVKGIDLEVGAGEIFGVLGTNGAGKTTTIEILEGYRSRSAGEVSVLGLDPARPTRTWRERIGLVLQESELDPVYTVARPSACSPGISRIRRDVDDTITLVGLAENRTKRVGALSGGQKRRVDVALGLIGDPGIVFLDSPPRGSIPRATRHVDMIRGLRDLGKTVVLTTTTWRRRSISPIGSRSSAGTRRRQRHSRRAHRSHRPRRTVIRFRLADGVGADAVQAAVGFAPEASGDEIVLRSDEAQHTLYRLTSWAEQAGVELKGLEVTRPTLDDVFLELTGEAGEQRDRAAERERSRARHRGPTSPSAAECAMPRAVVSPSSSRSCSRALRFRVLGQQRHHDVQRRDDRFRRVLQPGIIAYTIRAHRLQWAAHRGTMRSPRQRPC